ncbi:cytochrome c oxidase assembly protein [Microbacterium sp. P01]|uniref:cytochrome c oxidase assembly protein n=1 Tax=Microbacterium sp. P01 TaxID=3366261 RepID=UPI00366F1B80
MHDHGTTGSWGITLLFAAPFVLAALLYGGGVVVEARRGRPWPWPRTLAWLAGVAMAGIATAGPLIVPVDPGFVAHMWTHLLVGMVAPVLLVVACPVTLALRSLHVRRARQISRVLNSGPARVIAHPITAAILSVGGMWLLYATDLYGMMLQSLLVHLAVMTHFLVAGVLFTAAVIPCDPSPHRAPYPMRMVVLVVALAAHDILAKVIYASPPAGMTSADGQSGALLMYYGGDIVDAVIMTILCAQWYRAAGGRLLRSRAAPLVVDGVAGAP